MINTAQKILYIHCHYTKSGGEDICFSSEVTLLKSYGHEVITLETSNGDIISKGFLNTCHKLFISSWNHNVYKYTRKIIQESKPDIIHVHNFWFSLSPSIFGAAHDENIPIVLTLHNYRLICPNALLMHKGKICEKCIGKSTWFAVPRKCYRDSILQTAAVARMIELNRNKGTWGNLVDAYIALTEFSRNKFIKGGFPKQKIFLKPNFLVHDPGPSKNVGSGAIFVGRISLEKGSHILLDAWKKATGKVLYIVGDGPEKRKLEEKYIKNIVFTGNLEHAKVFNMIKQANFLIIPSICFEQFPMVLLESYACARPVIASRIGSLMELVKDGVTGLLFEPGNTDDLAEKLRWAWAHPDAMKEMGEEARREYELKYTAEKNYQMLMEIYQTAIE